ncbi:MAG: hypothetical protein WCD12_17010 [Candidatus Binatus sp.]|uniref:hypothetical protein n=1 Tax=Candidatus Binatus sp. TaxID=2811406 RepID=UPI003C78AAC7
MNPRYAAALALFVLAVSWSAQIGMTTAQISIAPPAPQQRLAPSVPKFTVDQQGNLVAPDDKPTVAPSSSGQSTLEIPQVPKEFEGCWESTISEPDSYQHLQGPRIAGWIPTTFRLCFRRTGNGPFIITFHDSKLDTEYATDHGYTISNYDAQTEVVSTDGQNQVSLHSVARMDQRGRILRFIPGPTVTISKTSDSRCLLVDDGATMNVKSSAVDRCSGSPTFGCNGQPWIQSTWHAQFHRTTDTNP